MFCATMEIATPSASPTASRATIVVGRVRIGRMAQAHHEGATMPTTIAPSGLADVNGIQLAYQTFGDDGLPPRSAVELFELLGGGQRDAGWDRSGMSRHRLAVLPGVTHYEINVSPALAAAVTPFLDEA
jgi:hypothetical protein